MKEKKVNWFWFILKIMFFFFIIIHVLMEHGYYEHKLSQKVAFTETNIRQFEADVKANKIIDVATYNPVDRKDYSNQISRFGQKLNDIISQIMVKGLTEFNDLVKSLLW